MRMSEKLLLQAIKSLNINKADNDTLANYAKSLEVIIDNDAFDGFMQEEAFCKLTAIHDAMGVRAEKSIVDEQEEELQGNSEHDEWLRLMIRSEQDGTLSFEFRGIRWDWNHTLNNWDHTPKK